MRLNAWRFERIVFPYSQWGIFKNIRFWDDGAMNPEDASKLDELTRKSTACSLGQAL